MAGLTLKQLIKSDIAVFVGQASAFQEPRVSIVRSVSILLTPPLMCSAAYRLAHSLLQRRRYRLSWLVTLINRYVTGAYIHPESSIGPGLYIPHPAGVCFVGTAGRGLSIMAGGLASGLIGHGSEDSSGGVLSSSPKIGDDVTIGARAKLLGPVAVGHSVLIASLAVVDMDLPAGARSYPPRAVITRP